MDDGSSIGIKNDPQRERIWEEGGRMVLKGALHQSNMRVEGAGLTLTFQQVTPHSKCMLHFV